MMDLTLYLGKFTKSKQLLGNISQFRQTLLITGIFFLCRHIFRRQVVTEFRQFGGYLAVNSSIWHAEKSV